MLVHEWVLANNQPKREALCVLLAKTTMLSKHFELSSAETPIALHESCAWLIELVVDYQWDGGLTDWRACGDPFLM